MPPKRWNTKKKAPKIGPYMFYLPDGDSYDRTKQWADDKVFGIISIDPGRTNFAFRFELRHKGEHGYASKIETLAFGNYDIRTENKDGICMEYNSITKALDICQAYFDHVHIVIIEGQMKINPDTPRVLQHVISYFLLALKGRKKMPIIVELDPTVKGNQLGYSNPIDSNTNKKSRQTGLKAWSIAKAKELCIARNDKFSLQIITNTKKKDDLADTICQAEALAILFRLPITNLLVSTSLTPQSVKDKFVISLSTERVQNNTDKEKAIEKRKYIVLEGEEKHEWRSKR